MFVLGLLKFKIDVSNIYINADCINDTYKDLLTRIKKIFSRWKRLGLWGPMGLYNLRQNSWRVFMYLKLDLHQ